MYTDADTGDILRLLSSYIAPAAKQQTKPEHIDARLTVIKTRVKPTSRAAFSVDDKFRSSNSVSFQHWHILTAVINDVFLKMLRSRPKFLGFSGVQQSEERFHIWFSVVGIKVLTICQFVNFILKGISGPQHVIDAAYHLKATTEWDFAIVRSGSSYYAKKDDSYNKQKIGVHSPFRYLRISDSEI